MNCCRCIIWFCIILDFLSDWFQFVEISVGEEYDRAGPVIWYALLIFCIIGTITFIWEIIVLYKDRDHTLVDCLSAWFEDVPQIIITAFIAYYHSDVGGLVQMIKAITTIFEAVVKIVVDWSKRYLRKSDAEDFNADCTLGMKVMSGMGSTITILGAILVLFISQVTINEDGVWKFHVPTIAV